MFQLPFYHPTYLCHIFNNYITTISDDIPAVSSERLLGVAEQLGNLTWLVQCPCIVTWPADKQFPAFSLNASPYLKLSFV